MFKQKEIVLKSGEKVLLRQPILEDANTFADFINELVKEETFEYSGLQTVEDEKEYIEFLLSEIAKENGVHIVAMCGDEKVAGADLTNCGYKKEHVVELQIYVKKEFRGNGLGTLLLKELEQEAKELKNIKEIVLTSFGNNSDAIRLYKKFGYKETGRLPKVLNHKGEFVDEIFMYKKIK